MKSHSMHGDAPSLMVQYSNIFACPVCNGDLNISGDDSLRVECAACKQTFNCEEGIPLLFWPNEWDSKEDVTDIVKSFYEETPFPNYEDVDSMSGFIEKARSGIFASLLDEQIPYGAKVLEVGCGTGQVSNFLGIRGGRTVFGVDLCLNSLNLGQEFRRQNSIDNVAFLQMNLFKPVFKPESFNLVICNGVLHHTSNPYLGFKSILRLVKKGGYIVIGLYNTIGRIPTDVRRFIFNISGNRFKFLDSRLKDESLEHKKRHTWFMDQYKHPHESKHTIGEVLKWFDEAGVEFINSIPKAKAFEPFSQKEKLFQKSPKGTTLDHLLVQLEMLLKGGSEGGFFVMIGQRKS